MSSWSEIQILQRQQANPISKFSGRITLLTLYHNFFHSTCISCICSTELQFFPNLGSDTDDCRRNNSSSCCVWHKEPRLRSRRVEIQLVQCAGFGEIALSCHPVFVILLPVLKERGIYIPHDPCRYLEVSIMQFRVRFPTQTHICHLPSFSQHKTLQM